MEVVGLGSISGLIRAQPLAVGSRRVRLPTMPAASEGMAGTVKYWVVRLAKGPVMPPSDREESRTQVGATAWNDRPPALQIDEARQSGSECERALTSSEAV